MQTRRAALLAVALLPMTVHGPGCHARAEPPETGPPPAPRPDRDAAARQRDLAGWWQRQQEREAEDRAWNQPREQRRNLTRDQIERWERMRDRARRMPTWPF